MRTESDPALAELIVQAWRLQEMVQAAEARDRFRLLQSVGQLCREFPQKGSREASQDAD